MTTFSSQRNLSNSGIKPGSPEFAGGFFIVLVTRETPLIYKMGIKMLTVYKKTETQRITDNKWANKDSNLGSNNLKSMLYLYCWCVCSVSADSLPPHGL